MTSEENGEWQLLKVWKCKKCKLLIHDAREVFDHVCSAKEEENKLLALRKTIEDRDISIDERDKFIDNQKIKINALNNRIEGLENFIKELNAAIDGCNNTVATKDKIIEEQKIVIEDHKKIICGQNVTIEEQNSTIENQKKNQGKIVEKVVYLEKGVPNTDENKVVDNINVDIWRKDDRIKDSKDSGYREEIEVEIFERGKGKEKIIVKNGKVIRKPDDIIIIGKNTSSGFIIKGIYRN